MSLLIFKRLAEERIREAMENGEFDNLELKGKPLKLEENPFIPEDLRVVYKILQNAGFLPKEVELRKEISKLEELLEEDLQDAYSKIKKLSTLLFHLNQIKKGPINIPDEYFNKVAEKIKLAKEKAKEPTEKKEINWMKLQTFLYISSLKPRRK
ncbi:DUF1992 domain-containing protein [Thermodesulfobacterium sp. TA1]|uniref:DnaJ family domain-containing protein n=1 Tax=Thermodesulfobacterium sp. TA1 TaxID=2234087 RepID=UPI001232B5B5|nr:DUF1992 domain-containing protein [Thermodesulfobacterium sp. TA1]QER41391.1 DUF1992 domain-containing protein [Thermodesulfobacterium sp. TA1]